MSYRRALPLSFIACSLLFAVVPACGGPKLSTLAPGVQADAGAAGTAEAGSSGNGDAGSPAGDGGAAGAVPPDATDSNAGDGGAAQ